MTHDVDLVGRLRTLLGREPGVTERRMFGGHAFLVHGHMAVAASNEGGLLVRADPEQTEDLLHDPGAWRYEMRGRPLRGWLGVAADAVVTEEALQRWADVGTGYARSLPPKDPGAPSPSRARTSGRRSGGTVAGG